MLDSQPPDRTISKSRYLVARLLPVFYMMVTTLGLPLFFTSAFKSGELSEEQEENLQQQIRAISVRAISQGESIGSGILLDRANEVYTVVTNAHVIQSASAPFQVQTPDGQTYAAVLLSPLLGQTQDVATLRFKSVERVYQTAKRATTPLKIGLRVWSAGYPLERTSDSESSIDNWGLMISKGRISHLLSKPLAGGYNIGYDNPIKKGMSGGPLLNQQGELVGINGIHSHPLWDSPQTLEDGSKVNPQLQEQIDELNWAIPISVLE
jgi:S1-C subfamily serine protease